MMAALLLLLPVLSFSFQLSPRNLATSNLQQAHQGLDTIIKIAPSAETEIPLILVNSEIGGNQRNERPHEHSDGKTGKQDDEIDLGSELDCQNADSDDSSRKDTIRRKTMTSFLTSGVAGSWRSDAHQTVRGTSIGERRAGGASKSRAGLPKTSQLLTAVRRAANAATKSIDGASNTTKVSRIAIGNAIESLLERRSAGVDYTKPVIPQMGILGLVDEAAMAMSHPLLQNPEPGTLLIKPVIEESKPICKESLIVRVATMLDDTDIASLRLSVFSDFSPEMRKQFCSRSRQVLSNRRLRGATCLVATTPAQKRKDGRTDIVLGSIECSVHELYGTLLGRRRTENSVLYITEVAVNPLYRRCGIGSQLLKVRYRSSCQRVRLPISLTLPLKGVDELAIKHRNVESLYLHVDVKNEVALSLYQKSGYSRVDQADEMYREFTRTLNLHDGATRGRTHYLLVKHLRTATWLEVPSERIACSVSPAEASWQPLATQAHSWDITVG